MADDYSMTPEEYKRYTELIDYHAMREKMLAQKAAEDKAYAESGPHLEGDLKAVGSGAGQGAIASTVGMAGDFGTVQRAAKGALEPNLPPWAVEADKSVRKYVPPTLMSRLGAMAPNTKTITDMLGIDYEPRSPREEYLKQGSAGAAGGAVMGPAAGMSRLTGVGVGGVSGASGQAAKQAGAPWWGEVAASMVPWLASLGITARTPNPVKATQAGVKAVGEQNIMDAAARQAKGSKTLNEQLTLSQAFPEDNYITGLSQALAREPQGQRIGQVIGQQEGSARTAQQGLIDSLSTRDMGFEGATQTQREGRRARIREEQAGGPDAAQGLRALFGPPPPIKKVPGIPGAFYREPEMGNWDTITSRFKQLGTPSDIEQVSQQLLGSSKTKATFPSIVKKEMQNAASATETSPNWMEAFTNKVYGQTEGMPTREKFKEKIKQVALSQGKTEEFANQRVKDVTDLMDALQMASRDRNVMGSLNETNFLQETGRNWASEAARSANIVAPLWRTGSALERHISKDTIEQLTRAVTTPDGYKLLLDIARFGPVDHRIKTLAMTLAASRGGAGTTGQESPYGQ